MQLLSCFLLLSLWYASDAQKSSLNCYYFTCDREKVLLFTIRANTGKSAIAEFDNNAGNTQAIPHPQGDNGIPDLFRSSFLDNLPDAIRQTGSKVIVTEMRKAGRVVARATFDVTNNMDQLDSHNWFTASRLINSFPYYKGTSAGSYAEMSVKGHRFSHYRRSFYIHHSHGFCDIDSGLMGIGENSNDACDWVSQGGKPPILFYAKKEGTYRGKESVVDYADVFLVYLSR